MPGQSGGFASYLELCGTNCLVSSANCAHVADRKQNQTAPDSLTDLSAPVYQANVDVPLAHSLVAEFGSPDNCEEAGAFCDTSVVRPRTRFAELQAFGRAWHARPGLLHIRYAWASEAR